MKKVHFLSILAISATIFLTHCRNKSNEKTTENAPTNAVSTPQKPAEIFDFDTEFNLDLMHNTTQAKLKTAKNWQDLSDYFCVYRFADSCVAIVVSIGGDLDKFDKIANGMTSEKDKIVWKTGDHSFKKSAAFAKALADNSVWQIYGTKGKTAAKITDIWYLQDQCSTLGVFKLANFDLKTVGEPLIASQKMLNLTYASLPNFNNGLAVYDSTVYATFDLKDDIKPVQFAHNDSIFLAAKEQLLTLPDPTKQTANFPERMIFYRSGAKIGRMWGQRIDFFGLPCD